MAVSCFFDQKKKKGDVKEVKTEGKNMKKGKKKGQEEAESKWKW